MHRPISDKLFTPFIKINIYKYVSIRNTIIYIEK